ncbi:MAG: RluA family pseudouridine synthase [Pseudomonadota bacterium]
MSGVETVEVAADDDGIRLDRWFKRHYPQLSHGRLEKLLRTGQVRLDGARAKGSTRIEAGQAVRIPPIPANPSGTTHSSSRNDLSDAERRLVRSIVIFEDESILVLNKPPGMAVQGGTGTRDHIDRLLPGLVGPREPAPKLVHRLDKETSGLLVVAKTASVAADLAERFRAKAVRKLYWALVTGVPDLEQGTLTMPVPKIDDVGPRALQAVQGALERGEGKPAQTHLLRLDRAARTAAWLALEPVTGRTHQLRIHCAALGHPILGDKKYSRDVDAMRSGTPLALHACRLVLPRKHGKTYDFRAPLPETLKTLWQTYGFETRVDPDFPLSQTG